MVPEAPLEQVETGVRPAGPGWFVVNARELPWFESEITPVTGKWRLETVEINGEIQMGEVRVNPGDLVVADDTGVVFIPRDSITAVLVLCEKKKQTKNTRIDAISRGVPVPVFYGKG